MSRCVYTGGSQKKISEGGHAGQYHYVYVHIYAKYTNTLCMYMTYSQLICVNCIEKGKGTLPCAPTEIRHYICFYCVGTYMSVLPKYASVRWRTLISACCVYAFNLD